MKYLPLLLLLVSPARLALAQEVVIDTAYYTPPASHRRVLTADPDDNPVHRQPTAAKYMRKQGADYELTQQLTEAQKKLALKDKKKP